MNAVLDRSIELSHESVIAGRRWEPQLDGAAASQVQRIVGEDASGTSVAGHIPFWARLRCAIETLASTILAVVFLTFSLIFSALMVFAVFVVLVCGLACYA